MSPVRAIPDGMTAITPHLVCRGAAEAIDFYKKAFGAVEYARLAMPDGKLAHGLINIGGSCLMLVDEFPEQGMLSPQALGGTPVSIHLYVTDVDAAFAQAIAAGVKVIMPLADMFWGDRYGVVADPFGHHWSLATHIRDLSQAEITAAMTGACPDGSTPA
jgi:uncharacterized glyoxalase superfamily protein PhnB